VLAVEGVRRGARRFVGGARHLEPAGEPAAAHGDAGTGNAEEPASSQSGHRATAAVSCASGSESALTASDSCFTSAVESRS
jgi:hypothetical protein